MLVIQLLLGFLAIVTGGLAIIGLVTSARRTSDHRDPMGAASVVSCVLALGFLGLLLK